MYEVKEKYKNVDGRFLALLKQMNKHFGDLPIKNILGIGEYNTMGKCKTRKNKWLVSR